MGVRQFSAVLFLAGCALGAESAGIDFYNAIRQNDLARLRSMTATREAANTADDHGNTPLMHAAAIGSTEAVKLLLHAGADVNAKNGLGVTPLILGAMDPVKLRILVEAGADVNAVSRVGRTALMIAAGTPGSTESVRLLLAKGANAKAADARGNTALTAAARAGDIESMRLLLARKADVDAGDFLGLTALTWAAGHADLAAVELLLANGADVNATYSRQLQVKNGLVAIARMTPLMTAPLSSPEVIRRLLRAGGEVNARDIRGMTPLMLAVATDEPNPEIIRMLMAAGADPEIRSGFSETARDWAAKFNDPGVSALVGAPKAAPTPAVQPVVARRADAKEAAQRGLALLQSVSTEYFKQSGCVGCHHQPLIGVAIAAGARNGLRVDQAAAADQLKFVRTDLLMNRELMLQGLFINVDQFTYSMLYLADSGYAADAATDSVAALVAAQQWADGSWDGVPMVRAPIEHSRWVRTALAAGILAHYPIPARRAEFDRRLAAASHWLAQSRPELPYERPFQVLGLHWAGAGAEAVARAAGELRKLQRPDGGWAQLEQFPTDAYATGVALYALRVAGMKPQDPAYRKGVQYLLERQAADGSWHVASRAPKIQPYFQSGFPYDHDQWISTAATAWSVAAIAEAVQPPAEAATGVPPGGQPAGPVRVQYGQ